MEWKREVATTGRRIAAAFGSRPLHFLVVYGVRGNDRFAAR
jgi:hypothetical protein